MEKIVFTAIMAKFGHILRCVKLTDQVNGGHAAQRARILLIGLRGCNEHAAERSAQFYTRGERGTDRIFETGTSALESIQSVVVYCRRMKKTGTQQFRVLVERDEDGFFVASVPALPGCHTQAKTFPELIERVRDAIRLCITVAKTDSNYRARIKRLAYEPSFVGMELVRI